MVLFILSVHTQFQDFFFSLGWIVMIGIRQRKLGVGDGFGSNGFIRE